MLSINSGPLPLGSLASYGMPFFGRMRVFVLYPLFWFHGRASRQPTRGLCRVGGGDTSVLLETGPPLSIPGSSSCRQARPASFGPFNTYSSMDGGGPETWGKRRMDPNRTKGNCRLLRVWLRPNLQLGNV